MSGQRYVKPEEVETQVFDWGTLKWLSEPSVTGAERFSFGIVILKVGTGHSSHNHPGVEEILFVISGEGKQIVGDEERHIHPGMLIHIPKDVYHETVNTGWEPLKLAAVYAPTGPEAILREMPDCKVIPPGQTPIV